MQIVLEWSNSIPEYQKYFRNIRFERPEKCKCGCVKFHFEMLYKIRESLARVSPRKKVRLSLVR
jgi:hypothetical protein